MPITKRDAHYGSPKQLIEYILDEKHDGEKVGIASSINCNLETALTEYLDNTRTSEWNWQKVMRRIISRFSMYNFYSYR